MLLANTSWLVFALMASLGIWGANMSSKLAGDLIPPLLFSLILHASACLIASSVFFFYWRGQEPGFLSGWPSKGLLFGVLGGISSALVNTSVIMMFSRNAPLGTGIMIVQVTALSIILLSSFFFFKEKLELMNALGLIFAFMAIPLMLYRGS